MKKNKSKVVAKAIDQKKKKIQMAVIAFVVSVVAMIIYSLKMTVQNA